MQLTGVADERLPAVDVDVQRGAAARVPRLVLVGADGQLGPGVTAFVGPNGQGKTNLVEAVGYLA
ncbi:hypothetical protein, partial [Streptomyces beihaiensis]